MIALLKKDLRLYRAALRGMIAVILVPYLLAAALWYTLRHPQVTSPIRLIGDAASLGMIGTVFLAAIVAGSAFALERREHWADFLAVLPARKLNIIASKFVIAFIAVFIPFFIHSIVSSTVDFYEFEFNLRTTLTSSLLNSAEKDVIYSQYILPGSAVMLTFGVAWLLSTLIKSPAISAGLGVFACLCLSSFIENYFNSKWDWRGSSDALFIVVAFPTGLAAFIAGTICFFKRITP
jgi:hypothetical protein